MTTALKLIGIAIFSISVGLLAGYLDRQIVKRSQRRVCAA